LPGDLELRCADGSLSLPDERDHLRVWSNRSRRAGSGWRELVRPADSGKVCASRKNTARSRLEEIRDELHRLRRLEEVRSKLEDGTPLSRAEVCRILGVDIKTTLAPLIASKRIRTVPWTRGEIRVPVAELRRLQRDGLPIVETTTRQRSTRAPSPRGPSAGGETAAFAIRNIKVR
jgi:hypothetical protein